MKLNRKFNKLLCAILAIAMLATMLPGMALIASASDADTKTNAVSVENNSFTDIADSPYSKEINLLNAISVLQGDPAGTFRPLDTVTRAEMAAIIVRIYGMESAIVAGPTQFEDVPESHWATGYINMAVSLGVINGDGDGKFRPDDKVQYNEAVKMLVCILGYGLEANEKGGWPAGYLAVANDIDMTEDVINQSGEASRETIAKLVSNAINIDYLQKTGYGDNEKWVSIEGRTLLSEKLKVEKVEGVITETYASAVAGEGSVKQNQIRIEDKLYLIGVDGIEAYAGYPVIAYAKLDEKVDKQYRTIIHYEINDENTAFLCYQPEDIAAADFTGIKVYESADSAKLIDYQLPATAPIFVNGVGNRNFDMAELKPLANGDPSFNGQITIIDIDEDEVIDVLFVEITKTMVISEVRKANGGFIIYGKDGTKLPKSGKIELDNKDIRLSITLDGKETDYTDLGEYDVLSYSVVGNTYNLQASSNSVSGVVESVKSDGKVVIDGTAYEYSTIAGLKGDECGVGDNATLYLDIYGKIAYVTTASASADDMAYLVDLGVKSTTMDGDIYQAKIYTQDNGVQVLSLDDEVDLIISGIKNGGGDSYETDTFADNNYALLKRYGLMDADGNFVPQLIKYSTNTRDDIISIEVAVNVSGDPSDYDEDTLKMFRKTTVSSVLGAGSFYAQGGGKVSDTSEGTPSATMYWQGADFIFVPKNGSNIIESDIAFSSASNFFTSGYANHSSADFTFYDVDDNGKASIIVAELDTSTSTEFSASRSATYMVVTSVSTIRNADGTKGTEITGIGGTYKGSQSEISVSLTNSAAKAAPTGMTAKNASDLKAGDIIAFSQMPNGKIYRWSLMYNADEFGSMVTLNGSNTLTSMSSVWLDICCVVSGYMTDYQIKKSGETFVLKATNGSKSNKLSLNDFDMVLRLDTKSGDIEEIDASDIPIPEEVVVDDPANLPAGVVEVDGAYYKCPKIVTRYENHSNAWVYKVLMYVDDGTFEN